MYCRRCNYDLQGAIESRRCPECGHSFNPRDCATFRQLPAAPPRFRRTLLILTIALGCLNIFGRLAADTVPFTDNSGISISDAAGHVISSPPRAGTLKSALVLVGSWLFVAMVYWFLDGSGFRSVLLCLAFMLALACDGVLMRFDGFEWLLMPVAMLFRTMLAPLGVLVACVGGMDGEAWSDGFFAHTVTGLWFDLWLTVVVIALIARWKRRAAPVRTSVTPNR